MESKEEIRLPHHLFTNTITALDLDEAITNAQNLHPNELSQLQQNYPIIKTQSHWYLTNCLVVVGNNDLRKGIITLYHNFPTVGHVIRSVEHSADRQVRCATRLGLGPVN